jgi:hypothetical protein
MGILLSSLTPYNNDLYASNLAHIPVLAIHGSDDENVPPRHSRQHVALIEAWSRNRENCKLMEVPKKGHWWDEVLSLPDVYEFIENPSKMPKRDWEADRKKGFTLTTANPDECGGRSGVRILELTIPGRLARLDVNAPQWETEPRGERGMFHGMNVRRFSYQPTQSTGVKIMTQAKGVWEEGTRAEAEVEAAGTRRYGPMIRLLATSGPMTIVANPSHATAWSIAVRYARDLYLYHRVVVNILTDTTALDDISKDSLRGNLVIIGRPDENAFTAHLLKHHTIPLSFPSPGVIQVAEKDIWERGTGKQYISH